MYEFNEVETTRMVPDDEVGNIPAIHYNFPSSWFLSKITSPGGNEVINLEYYSTTAEEEIYSNLHQSVSVSYTQLGYQYPPGTLVTTDHRINPPYVFIKRKFLKKISFKRGNQLVMFIDFVSATGIREDENFSEDRLLQQIKIYSNINATARLVKQYNFTYGYFSSATVPYTKRLRLDALQEVPADGSSIIKPPYSFEYNTTAIPQISTAALDHWGFYNRAGNTSLVPTILIGSNSFGWNANREPDLSGSSCTLLEKIKYPTGGYTTFSYELHKDENNIAIGGVRLKEIIDYSFENKKAVSKRYEYKKDYGTGSGKSNKSNIQYGEVSTWHHFHVLCLPGAPPAQCDEYTNTITTVSASSLFGLGAVQGSHIGYSRVTEYRSNVETAQPMGKTVYEYEVKPFMEHDEDIGSGDLIRRSVYDNTGKLLNELTNNYTYSNTGSINTMWVKAHLNQDSKTYYCKKIVNGVPYFEARRENDKMTDCVDTRHYYTKQALLSTSIYGQYKQLVQQTEKKYDQLSSSYQINTKKYTYGSAAHTYATAIEQGSSSNDLVITTRKYAGDYVYTTGTPDASTNGIRLLQSKNVADALIETRQYRKNIDGTNLRYIGGSVTTFLPTFPYPEKIFTLAIDEPVGTMTESNISNGMFVKDSRYMETGAFVFNLSTGNIVEQSKTNDVLSSYLWERCIRQLYFRSHRKPDLRL